VPGKPGRLIGISEGAEILGVNCRTIRRYIAAGKLPAYRVGPRLIKIDAADPQSLLQPVGGAV
jgi:excisionase family DNA binding protein